MVKNNIYGIVKVYSLTVVHMQQRFVCTHASVSPSLSLRNYT